MEFFASTEFAPKRVQPTLLPQCGACGLKRTCISPMMEIDGEGRKGILITGESPGLQEDQQGKPFVGPSGKYISERLADLGIDMRRDCWIGNALRCHPERNIIKNPKAIDYCRPLTIKAINELKPEKILLFGGTAVKSVIGWLWKNDVKALERWVGCQIPSQKLNAWILPTWHPSYLMRLERGSRQLPMESRFFVKHLERAIALEGRPWQEIPDYRSMVQIIMDPDMAARKIQAMMSHSAAVLAFDFETDRVKPDHPDARIVCCSVSNGKKSIAYPWVGAAIDATREMFISDVRKVGFSIKFEERWCRAKLGVSVRNWLWDGQLAAHILDNREGTKSLEYQEFVTLGFSEHKDEVKEYLKTKEDSGNAVNRISEAPLEKLLNYNALDSLIEWLLAKEQARKLGAEW